MAAGDLQHWQMRKGFPGCVRRIPFGPRSTGVSTGWKMGRIRVQLGIQPGNDSTKL